MTMYTIPLAGCCMLVGTSSCIAVVAMSLDTKRFAASCSVLHLQVCILSLLLIHHVLLSVGSMLQVVLHSWIASLLFLWIGEMYEVQGSRCAMHYNHAGRSTTTILILMLANSGFPISGSYTAEYVMLSYLVPIGGSLLVVTIIAISGVLAV